VKIRIYKSIRLPVVLHECETWFLILREEQTEGVSEQGVEQNILSAER
jgi:hypothetical protein